jgi:hypothetical protein
MSRKLLLFPALLALASIPLLAQDADPPSRVARINLVSGSVSFRPGSVDEWTAATLNYPLTTGDHLWADADSRVEVHAGSTAIRMAPRTAMSVLNLDDRSMQLSLTDGSLHIRVRQLQDDESFEVDTPNVAITILRPGEYRIDANGDAAETAVTVRAGSAQVTGGGAGFAVRPRETGRAAGVDNVTQDIGPAIAPSEFDYWCEDRDRQEDQESISAQYVPRDMVGYEDLDRNGVWTEMPDYGPVWRPRTVDAGWAPYRYGRWAWVDPWGWTWIDDAPWGFAPFHYGRWAMIGGGWAWVPGRMVVGARPVYAPALVVFVGTSRVGVAAWFPLGPREVYRPAYRVSDVYVRRVNVTHVTNVTVVNNVYVNQRIPGAVTAVSQQTFVSAGRVGRSGVIIDQREMVGARVIGTSAPIAPQRASVLAHAGPVAARPPVRVVERTVVVQRTPPPAPVAFERRREALQANPGRPLDAGQMDRLRGNEQRNPMVRSTVAAPQNQPGVLPRQERGPMRRPDVQNGQPAQPQAQPQPQQQQPGGFRRFGEQQQDGPAQAQPNDRVVGRPAPNEQTAPPAQQQNDGRRFGRPAPTDQPAQPQARPVPQDRPAPQDRPRPVDRPAPQDRPRPVDRPAPAAAPPAPAPAPRAERPAPEQKREPRQEKRTERKEERKDEKKDK